MRDQGRFTRLQDRQMRDAMPARIGEAPDPAPETPPAGEGTTAKRHTGTDSEFDA